MKAEGVTMALTHQKCEPCNSNTPPLSREDAQILLREIPGWTLQDGSIEKMFQFGDFKEAMRFVNHIAGMAEEEGHHPDIHIFYNKVRLVLSTHKIGGLSRNDFILASKIDALTEAAVA
jgi:4a-hydroxytetrahydrobiopterin dehydratase